MALEEENERIFDNISAVAMKISHFVGPSPLNAEAKSVLR